MSGRILYRGVMAGDSHPLAMSSPERPKSRPPSTSCDESLDPRIQVELEKLNQASEDINRLELKLNEARAKFRQVLTESTQMLNIQAKKLGSCIDKARPYYEARMKAKQAQTATQNAALRYERAYGQLAAAKEMVYLAEEGFFKKGQPFDPAWQEMLNHATMKVNDAEKERYESQIEHQRTAQLFAESDQTVKRLQKELRRHISKSRPYFEMKAKVNQQMEDQKKYISQLEEEVLAIKRHYAATLSNLERISDEIHKQRKTAHGGSHLGTRGVGVGAESPVPMTDASSLANVKPSLKISKTEQNGNERFLSGDECEVHRKDGCNYVPSKKDDHTKEVVCTPAKLKSNLPEYDSSERSPTSTAERNGGDAAKSDGKNIGNDLTATVVLRRSKQTVNVHDLNRYTRRPCHAATSPPEQPTASRLPDVQVTPPSASAPTSPTKPDPAQDLANRNVRDNAELMASIQRQKFKPLGLRANRSSADDLLECPSDTESLSGSLASASMMDDDQIQSLMLEMGEYAKFVEQMDEKQAKGWKRLSLPAKLTQLEKNFNLDEFLAEARIIEESDSIFGENLAPMAQEEDDLSFEFIEHEDGDDETGKGQSATSEIKSDVGK